MVKNRLTEIRCRNLTLDLTTPKIMGILNVTPDSFSDGGQYQNPEYALLRIEQIVKEGADIIDIGGESTRPGADPVSVTEELDRVLPVLEKAISVFPDILFSIDTTKYDVAEAALKAGVHIVNDVSGLQKVPRLAALCADYAAAIVLMHSQNDPKTMQDNPHYTDVVSDVFNFFKKQLELLKKFDDFPVILDPGIGFGKSVEHNLTLIAHLDHFLSLNHPLLIGVSRKSMIDKILHGRKVDERLAGSLSLHYHCLLKGASILRVHDIRESKDLVRIFNAIQSVL
ncbi:MAG: dihydropteroate synthase [Balneolaceae bacterium]